MAGARQLRLTLARQIRADLEDLLDAWCLHMEREDLMRAPRSLREARLERDLAEERVCLANCKARQGGIQQLRLALARLARAEMRMRLVVWRVASRKLPALDRSVVFGGGFEKDSEASGKDIRERAAVAVHNWRVGWFEEIISDQSAHQEGQPAEHARGAEAMRRQELESRGHKLHAALTVWQFAMLMDNRCEAAVTLMRAQNQKIHDEANAEIEKIREESRSVNEDSLKHVCYLESKHDHSCRVHGLRLAGAVLTRIVISACAVAACHWQLNMLDEATRRKTAVMAKVNEAGINRMAEQIRQLESELEGRQREQRTQLDRMASEAREQSSLIATIQADCESAVRAEKARVNKAMQRSEQECRLLREENIRLKTELGQVKAELQATVGTLKHTEPDDALIKQPGAAKAHFEAEQELSTPRVAAPAERYEIPSLDDKIEQWEKTSSLGLSEQWLLSPAAAASEKRSSPDLELEQRQGVEALRQLRSRLDQLYNWDPSGSIANAHSDNSQRSPAHCMTPMSRVTRLEAAFDLFENSGGVKARLERIENDLLGEVQQGTVQRRLLELEREMGLDLEELLIPHNPTSPPAAS